MGSKPSSSSDSSFEESSRLEDILDRLSTSKAVGDVQSESETGLPSQIGKFEIERLLACYGQATVLLARDTLLERHVVIKIYPSSANDINQLLNEGRVLSRIRSPHVATCYSVEQHESGLILVLEFVEGTTLAEILVHGPLPTNDCVDLARQIAVGLKPAHELKLLHRDLKPSNIMVQPNGQIKIIDFGLARTVHRDQMETRSGTPAFMPPETATGDSSKCDERTDIFGIGANLYSMLTSRPPFEGRDRSESRSLAAECKFAPINRAEVPEAVVAICERCLAKDPAERYPSLDELIDQFDQILKPDHASAKLVKDKKPDQKLRDRRFAIGAIGAVVGAVAILFAGLGYWFLNGNSGESDQRVFANFQDSQTKIDRLFPQIERDVSGGELEASLVKLKEALEVAEAPEFSQHYLTEVAAWQQLATGLKASPDRDDILAKSKILNSIESMLAVPGNQNRETASRSIAEDRQALASSIRTLSEKLGETSVLTLRAKLLLHRFGIVYPTKESRPQQVIGDCLSIRNSYQRELGNNSIKSLRVSRELAGAMSDLGESSSAIDVLKQASSIALNGHAPAQSEYFSQQLFLAELYSNHHNYPAAEKCFEGLQMMLPRFPDDQLKKAYRLESAKMHAFCQQGEYQKSILAGEKAMEIYSASDGRVATSASHHFKMSLLLRAYSGLSQKGKATGLADLIMQDRHQTFSGDAVLLAATMNEITDSMWQIGQQQRAIESAVESAEVMAGLDTKQPIFGMIQTHNKVLLLAEETGSHEMAQACAERLYVWVMSHDGFEQSEWIDAARLLADHYRETSQTDQAKAILEHVINQIENSMPVIASKSNQWRAIALRRLKTQLKSIK